MLGAALRRSRTMSPAPLRCSLLPCISSPITLLLRYSFEITLLRSLASSWFAARCWGGVFWLSVVDEVDDCSGDGSDEADKDNEDD